MISEHPEGSFPPAFQFSGYSIIDRSGSLTAWLGREREDTAWDFFLKRVEGGHFQQSAAWSRVKSLEGWRPIRVVLEQDGMIVGGFQMLSRRLKSLAPVGYVIKGPVRWPQAIRDDRLLLGLLSRVVRQQGLWAAIVQLPDTAGDHPAWLPPDFLPNRLVGIIEANLVVDLTPPLEEIQARFRKSTRYGVYRAQREGVRIQEGGAEDLPAFFELMLTTCKKQRAVPNPSRIELLREMWSAFAAQGCLRLTLAMVATEVVSAQLAVAFGDSVCIWKRGWSYKHPRKHPNHLLTYETLVWAKQRGYKTCDFTALNRENAELLLQGGSSRVAKDTRDFFHLGFGGSPVLLPRASICVPNPVFRNLYRLALTVAGRCIKKPLRGSSHS